jgi:hypothetical protein
MQLDIYYVHLHWKIYVFRKAKTTYNLERREYMVTTSLVMPIEYYLPVLQCELSIALDQVIAAR